MVLVYLNIFVFRSRRKFLFKKTIQIQMLQIIGLILLGISGIGTIASCILEARHHEKFYFIMMKVLALLMAISGVLIGIGG